MYKLLYRFGDGKVSPQMTIRIGPEIKKRFSRLVRAEGKTPGQVLGQLIENYIKRGILVPISMTYGKESD
jgi:hypothetical protein